MWHFTEGNPFARHYLLPRNHALQLVALGVGVILTAGAVVCLLRVFDVLRSRPVTYAAFAVVTLASISYVFIIRGWVPEAAITADGIVPAHIKMPVGWSVSFIDPPDGTAEVLVVGGDASPGAPRELLGDGLALKPGDTVRVAFKMAGRYPIGSRSNPKLHMLVESATPTKDDDDAGD
jgi:hypothetical protein